MPRPPSRRPLRRYERAHRPLGAGVALCLTVGLLLVVALSVVPAAARDPAVPAAAQVSGALAAGQVPAVPAAVPTQPPDGVRCRWSAPVEAAVADPFRLPPHRYGPGNRGIEYATAAGDLVTAVADGQVAYAGTVAARGYVVVLHPGGLRSTVGPLRSLVVVRDQGVTAGDRLGEAAPGLHLTARVDGRYVDPQPLLDGRCLRPHLVAVPEARPGAAGTLDGRTRPSGPVATDLRSDAT